jgi:hypothetical protein
LILLFHCRRVYELLSSMMYAPVAKADDAEDSGISDLDRSELQVAQFLSLSHSPLLISTAGIGASPFGAFEWGQRVDV